MKIPLAKCLSDAFARLRHPHLGVEGISHLGKTARGTPRGTFANYTNNSKDFRSSLCRWSNRILPLRRPSRIPKRVTKQFARSGEKWWQLGGAEAYTQIAASAENGTPPDATLLEHLLIPERPIVMLMDELVAYLFMEYRFFRRGRDRTNFTSGSIQMFPRCREIGYTSLSL